MNIAAPAILIAGIGNIFLGDDAFGVEVAQQLLRRNSGPTVQVRDFGIRGLDLVYALQDPWDVLILIDAIVRREGPPGTLYLLEPPLEDLTTDAASAVIDAHSMDPLKVLRTAAAMGPLPRRILIVGCEPATLPGDFDDGATVLDMTPAVRNAIPEAIAMIDQLLEKLCAPLPAEPQEKGDPRMSDLKYMVKHPTEAVAQTYRQATKTPYKTAAVVLLAAGALGLYWMWPEIQRYAKIKRM